MGAYDSVGLSVEILDLAVVDGAVFHSETLEVGLID